ncbi:U32 family peptidase, partial [Helicobacter pylori]|uniref:U32 family peptidase n=1 Tax=Helicobacter pylori TaxID=210 RepID=UPI00217E2FF0
RTKSSYYAAQTTRIYRLAVDDFYHNTLKPIALILSRQAKAIGDFDFDAAFISKEASDNNIYRRGGGSAFPLFCIA